MEKQRMPTLTFSHMALSCQNPLAVERFYTQHFGFKRARVIPMGEDQIVFIKSDGVYLELIRASKEVNVPPDEGNGPEYPAWRHLAFIVDDVDAKLVAMGTDAHVTMGPMNFDSVIPGWRSAWIADPEGNIIEISQGYVDQENPPQLS